MIHIIPIDDAIEHTADCECCHAFLDHSSMWIHHAKDKREQFERANGNDYKGKPWGVFWEDEKLGTLKLLEG